MRIGSVPYLNARPLVDALERGLAPELTLSYAIPSRLIEQLQAGELDVAMASSFGVLAHPGWALLPGLGVATAGPCWSARLLSRVPLTEIHTLALDSASRSSNALARIVLADGHHVHPKTVPLPSLLNAIPEGVDAAVVIGDIGLATSGDGMIDLDLGQAWYDLTGLPFLFAGWVARDPKVLETVGPILLEACDEGLRRLHEITRSESERLALPEERVYHYLSEIMHYHADERDEAGLREFGARARRLGLLTP